MELTKDAILSVLDKRFPRYLDTIKEATAAELATSISSRDTVLDRQKELYKLEYEKAAERYQSIYASIWTNFSYMSVVAGALLSFGSTIVPNVYLVAFLASLPLIFWYVVSFIPMNNYGNDAIHRLDEIETKFYELFSVEMGHFGKFNSRRTVKDKASPRVRPAMVVFGIAMIFFSIVFAIKYFDSSFRIEPANLNDTKQLAKTIFPDNCDASSATGLNKILLERLSASTQKSLCELRGNSEESASNEVKSNLVRAFNSIVEGESLCASIPEGCRWFGGINLFYFSPPANRTLVNRRFLENFYAGSVNIHSTHQACLFLCMMFLVYMLISYRVGREVIETVSEMREQGSKKDRTLNLVIVGASPVPDQIPSELLTKLRSLLPEKNLKSTMQVWKVDNINEVKWSEGENEDLRIPGLVVDEAGKLRLETLNKANLKPTGSDKKSYYKEI